MIEIKHNDYEEMCIDDHINELFDNLDIDTLIMLYFYGELIKSIKGDK